MKYIYITAYGDFSLPGHAAMKSCMVIIHHFMGVVNSFFQKNFIISNFLFTFYQSHSPRRECNQAACVPYRDAVKIRLIRFHKENVDFHYTRLSLGQSKETGWAALSVEGSREGLLTAQNFNSAFGNRSDLSVLVNADYDQFD